ncbi:SDR family oxidoreductase [Sulfurimonas sp.]|nr:SDR family oxidoreductase [Sulfurimonas sp.]
MKNILVTGGTGYVGTVLVNELLRQGHVVTVVDTMWFGDYLEEHKNLTKIKTNILEIDNIPMANVDTVFHLANIANDPTGDLNSKLTWEVNALASKLLVEKAIDNNVKQFVYASSGSVYGIKEEAQVTEDLDLVPISDYNKTKMISERVLSSYEDKINIISIRPATVCGYSPRMRLDVSVNMLTMQALQNKKITVFGGKQVRPNIHILDMIGVYIHFLNNNELTGIYNAGFENISILDIAEKVAKKIDAEIIVTPSNDPRSYRLNSDKLLNTGFSPKYGVDYAIAEIIEKYNSGILKDEDRYYNLKVMDKLGIGA